jgi:glycopeptide antibiotics resistance protein
MKKSFIIAFLIVSSVFLLLLPMLIQLTSYLHSIVLAVVFFCLFILAFFLVLLIRKKVFHLPNALFLSLLLLYTIALLILLFFRPNGPGYTSINLIPFNTITYYLSGKVNWLISFYNLAANIGLFIPYGIYIMVIRKRDYFLIIQQVILPVILISLIELLQFISHRGSLDIDDLILNILGIFTGYLFYPLFKRVVILIK